MDYKPLAKTIIDNIGGKSNVQSVIHCATRLRFTLLDASKANTEVISKTKGVLKVINAGGQYQIVIGPDVPQVYQEVISLGGYEAVGTDGDPDAKKEDNRNAISKVLEAIASIFQPVIPAITGAGLLKAILALCITFHWTTSDTQTYIILSALADAAFYFLPILLAQSCAKKFKCNQGTAMALAGFLLYPSFLTMIKGAEAITIFGFLPITKASYASSVIPIILGVWFMSYVEKLVQRICPKAVKFFFVPFFSLFIGGVVTIFALGPIGAWLSNYIQIFFTWLKGVAPWIIPTVVGIFTPLLVMTGTHYGLIPIGTNNLGTVGHDAVVGPGMLVSNTAQGAAGLAVALRSKNQETKQLASSAGLTGILGITEPILYGINLKFVFPLYAAMIGGGVGGLFLGLTGVERFGAGSPGLLVLPVYLPTEEAKAIGFTMSNFTCAIIGVLIAMLVSFVSCWIMYGIWAKRGKLDPSETRKKEEKMQ
ncbi:PTS transporter subunit EIIC [Lacrimispora sp.]|uniref:PTS transporter subunit EIIC n=1 Tax=Lacrimispora sp. TaxID=2719234 RepID=UPI0028992FC5|nr:PTS transporter subunit EIIC [Lacrimispora sp.]